jgi:opacity protein-like surface antigen
MYSVRLTIPVIALTVIAATGAARAADYPQPMPPPPPIYQPPQTECCAAVDNWYLRGFVGAGMTGKTNLDISPLPADTFVASNSIGDSIFLGGAVGYNFNSWLRFDISGEYRSKARINALVYSQPGGSGPVAVDQYQGDLKSWVFLANAFVDLGTWNCFTPFVGVGIGGAYNSITNFTDVTPNVAAFGADGSSFGLGRNTSNMSLAWALYAGVGYKVTKNFSIDLSYRYLSYGSAKETVDCFGANGCNDYKFKDLTSHDIMLGLRWTCCDNDQPAPRYVYQPQPYTPPPVYMQPPPPPLRSKG